MPLTIVYFASIREAVGSAEERIDVPAGVITISDLLDHLSANSAHAAAFANRERLKAALDQEMVPFNTPIGTARELALFPPVTGG